MQKTMGFPLWLCYTFRESYTDQEQSTMSTASLQMFFHISLGFLYLLATNLNSNCSLSMARINILLSTRDNSEAFASIKLISK